MATATTTFEAIRDQQVRTIRDISPALVSDLAFHEYRGDDGNLLEWALANPQAATRRFDVIEIDAGFPPEVTNLSVEFTTITEQVVVAYARQMGGQASTSTQAVWHNKRRDIYDMIRSDRDLIDGKSGIGLSGYVSNYVSGQHRTIRTAYEIIDEEDSPVLFSILTYQTEFYKAVAA